jgi:hypothetical protein
MTLHSPETRRSHLLRWSNVYVVCWIWLLPGMPKVRTIPSPGIRTGSPQRNWGSLWWQIASIGMIRQYVISRMRTGDQTLGPVLRFRGGSGNDHCEICDQGTGRGPLILCDQCECTYHEECLGDLTLGAGNAFICPKCRDNLEEIINLRLREQRPPPPPWERYSIPPRMVDPPILPECPDSDLPLKALIASPPTGGYVAILKDPNRALREGCPRTTTGVSQRWFSGHFRQVFFNTIALPRINIGADVWGESSIMTGVYQRFCSSTLHIGWGLCNRVCQVLVCRGSRYGVGGGVLLFNLGLNLGGVGPVRGLRGGGRKGWC